MVYAVEIAASAERDLGTLYEHVRAAGSIAAQRWFDELGTAIRSLKSNPERGARLAEASGVRQLFYGRRHSRYRLLYKVDTGEARVTILHIRHGARRWPEASG